MDGEDRRSLPFPRRTQARACSSAPAPGCDQLTDRPIIPFPFGSRHRRGRADYEGWQAARALAMHGNGIAVACGDSPTPKPPMGKRGRRVVKESRRSFTRPSVPFASLSRFVSPLPFGFYSTSCSTRALERLGLDRMSP